MAYTEVDGLPPVDQLLRFGMLPPIHDQPSVAVELLESYVHTYLHQEIL